MSSIDGEVGEIKENDNKQIDMVGSAQVSELNRMLLTKFFLTLLPFIDELNRWRDGRDYGT